MEKDISFCKFCGQTFHYPEGEDPEEYAINHCRCTEAVEFRTKRQIIDEAKEALEEVFAQRLIVGEAADEETLNSLRTQLEKFFPFFVDFQVLQLSVSVNGFGKVAISVNANREIKIKRTAGCSVERKI